MAAQLEDAVSINIYYRRVARMDMERRLGILLPNAFGEMLPILDENADPACFDDRFNLLELDNPYRYVDPIVQHGQRILRRFRSMIS